LANSDLKPRSKHQKTPEGRHALASQGTARRQAGYGTIFSATIRKRQPKIATLRKSKMARINQCLMFNPPMAVTSFPDYP
jgi:hypothetical protein